MVDYNRLELAIDLLAEDLEKEASNLRLVKVLYAHEYREGITSVKEKVSRIATRLDALLLDLGLDS